MAGEKSPLEKEALQRLADARRFKADIDRDLREAYFFTAPQRCRDVSSQTNTTNRGREHDTGELQISFGMEVSQDFATEMLNTFTPEVIEWVQQKAGVDIEDEQERDEINAEIAAQTTRVMDAIKQSNFYSEAAGAYMPDLALGTVGLLIDDPRPAEPFVCQAIPIRELEINIGPYGGVDDRFVVRHTKHRFLRALLGDLELPAEIEKKIKDKPNERCRVTWGWWRLWSEIGDVVWQHIVMVGEKVVHHGQLKGVGSCPLLVGRFNRDPMFPFGHGPTLQSLPDMRRLDETEALKIENADFQIHPAVLYQDDGVLNLSNGIEPGMGYSFRQSGGDPWHSLAPEGNVSFAEFETQRVEQRIRKLHFVDFPEQQGKTPPTAEQWMDELQRAKRRIGTPGKVFFKELPMEVFLRFKHLLTARGVIADVKVDGKTIALTPYDPTEQAQEFQDVQIAGRILQMAQAYFGQTAALEIDGSATLKNIKDKLRDKIVVLRPKEEIEAAIQQFAPVLGGGGGGMPPGGGVA